jgi:(2R)-sulfolactate sulfo-lyase subunit beta
MSSNHEEKSEMVFAQCVRANQVGDQLIDIMIHTCNGRPTCAEALGHREFMLTKLY